VKNLYKALGILISYDMGDNVDIAAEHDELWMGGPDAKNLSEVQIKELNDLGVHWDEDSQSWHMFV